MLGGRRGLVRHGAFALSPGFIYYGGQMKQYATEVAASLLMTLLASRAWDEGLTLRRAATLGAWGLGLAPPLAVGGLRPDGPLPLPRSSRVAKAGADGGPPAGGARRVLGAGIAWALFTNLGS